jgi:hypothetical protein
MTPLLETPAAVAGRLDREPGEVAAALEQMARKGLLFRRRSEEAVSYAAVPYVVGLFEFQVGRMGRDFAEVHEAYYESTYHKVVQSNKTPVLRTIPIQGTHCGCAVCLSHNPGADRKKLRKKSRELLLVWFACRLLCRERAGAVHRQG